MKKLYGLVFSVLCVLLMLSFTAAATETDTPEPIPPEENIIEARAMGDADDDGKVTAGDARMILRYSVALDDFTMANCIYADIDFNNKITAADARLALRISVQLEEKQEYAFEISEITEPTCIDDGYAVAKCQLTGKEITLNTRPNGHTLPDDFLCREEVECPTCKETVFNSSASHDFEYDKSGSTRTCKRCGFSETVVHKHKFSDGKCSCGITAKAALGDYMNKYLKENGKHEEGICYINQYTAPLSYALIYDEARDFSYAYCGFAIEEEGVVVFYDFNYDFEGNMIELMIYTEEGALAYAYGSIKPAKVTETADGDAITIEKFESVPELNGLKAELAGMMEGAVYDSIVWLRRYCADEADFDFTEEAFADFTKVYNYRLDMYPLK